jgi:hypothetical protein
MRGYVSFVLVLLASLVLLDLLALYDASHETNLSDAVAAERAYGIEMNVKEAVIQSVRLGAGEGFGEYDRATDVRNCRHCPDNFCAPPTPADPYPPNACDPPRCSLCFRESGARKAAIDGALETLRDLEGHRFDQDFSVSFGGAELEVLLRPDPLSKNGYSLDFARFRKKNGMNISSDKFRIDQESKIPGGFTIESPGVG